MGTAPSYAAIDGSGLKVAVVAARFNTEIVQRLVDGAREALLASKVSAEDIQLLWVPGAFELPLLCAKLADNGAVDAILALGCVIQGDTDHHLYVGGEAARGIAEVSRRSGIPIGFGVLTCRTKRQAEERAGGKVGNAGTNAALAALETVCLLKQL